MQSDIFSMVNAQLCTCKQCMPQADQPGCHSLDDKRWLMWHGRVEVVTHHAVEAGSIHVAQARQLPHARGKGRRPGGGHPHLCTANIRQAVIHSGGCHRIVGHSLSCSCARVAVRRPIACSATVQAKL